MSNYKMDYQVSLSFPSQAAPVDRAAIGAVVPAGDGVAANWSFVDLIKKGLPIAAQVANHLAGAL